MRILFFKVFAN
jgi:hypothetical protein